ncbi:MAG: hypothetical protein ACLUI3_04410 [Christensenellales bacterium]
MLAVKLGVVLVGLVILLTLGYAAVSIWKKKIYGDARRAKDGFGEVPTAEIDGVPMSRR